MSSSILQQFAVLQCSNALSQMSNLCLSLPNYNLSLPILCSGYQPEKYMYGMHPHFSGFSCICTFQEALTAFMYTQEVQKITIPHILCIHGCSVYILPQSFTTTLGSTRKQWLAVDHCLYDRMVHLSLHAHCMQNQSPTSQYQAVRNDYHHNLIHC